MIVKINGSIAEPPSFWDKVGNFSDKFIEKETEIIMKPVEAAAESTLEYIVSKIGEGLDALLTLLNSWSPEIITLGVVACAFGFMLGPIWNGGATKWSGRLFVTLLVGVIWRMLLL